MRVATHLSIASVILATLSFAAPSLADRVARLHVGSKAGAVVGEADKLAIDRATESALHVLGHTTATDAEVLQGEGAAGSLVGTSAGLVAVGKTTGSDWVVVATIVASTGPSAGERIELEACQVSSGRVETIARDFPPGSDASALLREMLAVLLRPQGVGDDPLPWEKSGAASVGSDDGKAKDAKDAKANGAASTPHVAATYAVGGRFALGVGGGLLDLLARGEGAVGSPLAGTWSIAFIYRAWQRDETSPAVELVARGGGVFGPGPAARATIGARGMVPLTTWMAAGGGGMLGVFVPTGNAGDAADRPTRALFGITATTAFTLLTHLQLDLDLLSVQVLPAKEGTLVFFGSELSLLARF